LTSKFTDGFEAKTIRGLIGRKFDYIALSSKTKQKRGGRVM